VQAQKFGADFAVPTPVTKLDCAGFALKLHVDGGMCLSARTSVIATGAKYRRPEIPNLANYEGRGVHYWASPIEASLCRGEEVVLVGGGNSAGQAVAFLAGHAAHVHVLVRGPASRARCRGISSSAFHRSPTSRCTSSPRSSFSRAAEKT
jgi:thioredoxin reductase (NADPH)